jgi:hypothetical protein
MDDRHRRKPRESLPTTHLLLLPERVPPDDERMRRISRMVRVLEGRGPGVLLDVEVQCANVADWDRSDEVPRLPRDVGGPQVNRCELDSW